MRLERRIPLHTLELPIAVAHLSDLTYPPRPPFLLWHRVGIVLESFLLARRRSRRIAPMICKPRLRSGASRFTRMTVV